MKIGLIADIHAGYVRGTRDNAKGVNVREQDVLDAASSAVTSLMNVGVDAIVDLGDMFHVPAPKKRALLHMMHLIKNTGIPWYSANGNHTLQRTKSDLHVYDVLHDLCPKFHGYTKPTVVGEISAYLIPYGTEVEALEHIPEDIRFLAGHFACDDVPFPGEHVSVKDLPDLPTFLGHYHTRTINLKTLKGSKIKANVGWEGPVYIGSTERFAWGEANNPTGVAIYENNSLTFIEHRTREWEDVTTDVERVFDELRGRDLEGKIVRVSVEATVPEYHGLDIKSVRDAARSALEFQIRRVGAGEALVVDHADTQTYSLLDAWQQHTASLRPAEMRKAVQGLGSKALAGAGVGE